MKAFTRVGLFAGKGSRDNDGRQYRLCGDLQWLHIAGISR